MKFGFFISNNTTLWFDLTFYLFSIPLAKIHYTYIIVQDRYVASEIRLLGFKVGVRIN